ncbi:hypothetical protein [Tunturiibacter gelidoferens]|uniref:Uncharacterized protein n=2 Tax=Tunturiibacter gelidiferens TaxID=3069689 RepID=A0AAU7YY89_9BACT|nr:hypothetical protein [Edaphobacter lichenicola]MBB5338095.1 hypothetical protein [Edaphobacter lichenicola]
MTTGTAMAAMKTADSFAALRNDNKRKGDGNCKTGKCNEKKWRHNCSDYATTMVTIRCF